LDRDFFTLAGFAHVDAGQPVERVFEMPGYVRAPVDGGAKKWVLTAGKQRYSVGVIRREDVHAR